MLSNKNIIVTGAAGGLGFSFAEHILSLGAKVCIIDSNKELLHSALKGLKAQFLDNVFGYETDISSELELETALTEISLKFNARIDGLVNNAAIATNVGGMAFSDISLDLWHRVLNVNVIGTWLVTKKTLPYLKNSPNGKIVNIASDTALWGAPKLMSYVASKGAVIAMSKSMARELGEHNICVNVVAPGLVKTKATDYVPKERHSLYENNRALARKQLPEDVNGVVSFLLSDNANFLTGQTIPVNGGFIFV